MLDEEPPRGRVPALRPAGERKVNVDARARACAAREPRVQVDEDGADELAALERGVPGYVRVAHGELDDARRAGAPDEGVNDQPAVVYGLDVRRLGWVQWGVVDDGAVEGDGLDLWCRLDSRPELTVWEENVKREEVRLTKLYLYPTPSWKNACSMPNVDACSV